MLVMQNNFWMINPDCAFSGDTKMVPPYYVVGVDWQWKRLFVVGSATVRK